METVHRSCPICEASCGLTYEIDRAGRRILSVRGDVLHNHSRAGTLADGDLVLMDSGAEVASGWASDVTRTWPAAGRFTADQRAIYDLVLAANETAIAACTALRAMRSDRMRSQALAGTLRIR